MTKLTKILNTFLVLSFFLIFNILTSNVSNATAPTNGLVGYWNFDEGSGTTAGDLSGNGNTGTISGAMWTTGKVGSGALKFDGSDDYTDVGNVSAIDVATQATWSFWMKQSSLDNSKTIISKYDGNFGVISWIIRTSPSSLGVGNDEIVMYFDGTNLAYTNTNILAGNTWYHMTFVYDGSQSTNPTKLKLYVNGVATTLAFNNTIPSSLPSAARTVKIGAESLDAGARNYFNGLIDEVRVYNRALTAQEVTDIYNDLGSSPTLTPTPPPPSPLPVSLPPGQIIDSSRRTDWSGAGAGTIPARAVNCAVLNPGSSVAEINSAIQNCPAGQIVYLNSGTYNLTGGIIFNDKSEVTLRGAGADKTFLVFSGNHGCAGLYASVCVINSHNNYWGQPGNTANWIAGYAQGSMQITLDNSTNLKVGSPLILDQENDPNTDNGGIWVAGRGANNIACVTCASGPGRRGPPSREQMQVVKVMAINGNQVILEDPLIMPNWRSERNPGAWWSSDSAISSVGIENLSMDHLNSLGTTGIAFNNAYGSWVKGVRSIMSNRSHVWIIQSSHITVRDSYFYGTKNATTQSYGIEHFTASKTLIENNIFQHVSGPTVTNNAQGSVFSYNYSFDNYVPNTSMYASSWHHGPGISYLLYEGNEGLGFRADYFHGLSHFTTNFRNRWLGSEMGKNLLTIPLYLQMGHRYFNFIGNVLGTAGYHNRYVSQEPDANQCSTSIYALGWGGFCGNGPLANDSLVAGTLFRWGNYDTVTNSVKWDSSEVPASLSKYANAVPASQSLPASLYLALKPSWWGSTPWPAIGPDVIGGSGPGGHSYDIPAKQCYHNSPKDSNNILIFNPTNCYASGGATPPPAPSPNPTPPPPSIPSGSPASPPTSPSISPDFNRDGIVNSLDFSLMNSKWLQSYSPYDLNQDGLINSLDFSILSSNWGKSW